MCMTFHTMIKNDLFCLKNQVNISCLKKKTHFFCDKILVPYKIIKSQLCWPDSLARTKSRERALREQRDNEGPF